MTFVRQLLLVCADSWCIKDKFIKERTIIKSNSDNIKNEFDLTTKLHVKALFKYINRY